MRLNVMVLKAITYHVLATYPLGVATVAVGQQ